MANDTRERLRELAAAFVDDETAVCEICGCTNDEACVNERGQRCIWALPTSAASALGSLPLTPEWRCPECLEPAGVPHRRGCSARELQPELELGPAWLASRGRR